MKRIITILLCLSMLMFAAGCTSSPAPSAPAQEAPSAPAQDPAPEPADEPVTLTFWHIWGSGDSNSEAVAKVISDFEALNQNIKIDVQTFENEAYKTTIKTNVSGDTAPDLFSTWGGGFSKAFVDAGKVMQLDSYLNDGTMDRIVGGALTNFTYDGGIYGLTFGMSCSGLFCNTALFEKYNVKLPTTWDELLAAVDTFNENGVIPITTSIKERWVIGMLFEAIALKAVGAPHTYATLTKNGGSFADPQFLNAANRLMELVEKGAFNTDAAAISRDEAEVPVKMGQAAMYYMGSWASGLVEGDDSVDKGKYKFVAFPTLPDGNGSATEFNGGAADGIMVSANTKYPDEAAAFIKYFTENLAREDYQAGNYLPLWKGVQVDESVINPVTRNIVEVTSQATDFILWWDTLMEGQDVTTYQDALDAMVLKQITPEAFIEELKKIQP